jgi:hypothetical protein
VVAVAPAVHGRAQVKPLASKATPAMLAQQNSTPLSGASHLAKIPGAIDVLLKTKSFQKNSIT